jgi:hypothetical protein
MTDESGGAKGELQFDKADFGSTAPAALACAECSVPIGSAYFEAAGRVLCEPCRYKIEEFLKSRAGLGGGLKALAAGVAAGVVGWIIYYAVLALSGYEFGLIAVVVGFMVGRAVRWGSGNRGGAWFQAMAIAITYVTIVSTYVPMVVKGIRDDAVKETKAEQAAQQSAAAQPAAAPGQAEAAAATPAAQPDAAPGDAQVAAAVQAAAAEHPAAAPVAKPPTPPSGGQVAAALAVFGLLILALPFLQGFSNVIGIAIIGFALYEAWRVNRRVKIDINGPFTPGRTPAAA